MSGPGLFSVKTIHGEAIVKAVNVRVGRIARKTVSQYCTFSPPQTQPRRRAYTLPSRHAPSTPARRDTTKDNGNPLYLELIP